VRTAALHDGGELRGLAVERRSEMLERRDEIAYDGSGGRDVDRRREHVVAGLRRVHVVVRMHRLAEALAC
jgi:hypothetical protein